MAELVLLRRDLDQQALAQIARPHSGRVEMLHQVDAAPQSGSSAARLIPRSGPMATSGCSRQEHCAEGRGQLFLARRQVAVLVQIADHELRRLVQLADPGVRAPNCHAR